MAAIVSKTARKRAGVETPKPSRLSDDEKASLSTKWNDSEKQYGKKLCPGCNKWKPFLQFFEAGGSTSNGEARQKCQHCRNKSSVRRPKETSTEWKARTGWRANVKKRS